MTTFNKDDFYPNGKSDPQIDYNKLLYILLSRGILSSRDFDFMLGKESFESWKEYNNEYKRSIIYKMLQKGEDAKTKEE